MSRRLFTSESATEGHPDKVADRISDAVLDAFLAQDPFARVACETFVTTGLVLIGGEITADPKVKIDIAGLARETIREIGYDRPEYGFCYSDVAVLVAVHEQSPDIAQAVVREELGAGDSGIIYGYACRETPELMPLPIMLAHRLTRGLALARKEKRLPFLRPDGKAQVTVEYENKRPRRAHTVVLSAQHDPEVGLEELRTGILKEVIEPALGEWLDRRTRVLINPSGRFVIGGPPGDTGMTGRKIEVDTYGGYGSHGGGALSGKDPTKVDRSGSYMARYIAKNIVAAGLAEECEVQIVYAIGEARPVALTVNTFASGVVPDESLEKAVEEVFDARPAAIIDRLELRRPIYKGLSAYGHFGRTDLARPWEKTDRIKELKAALKRA
ncbi:MAG: methionine adenosyltransferase [Candidatus Bipolaricaulia bacterium]